MVWTAGDLAKLDPTLKAEAIEYPLSNLHDPQASVKGSLVVEIQVPNAEGGKSRPGLGREFSSFTLKAFCALSPEEQKTAAEVEANGGVGVSL